MIDELDRKILRVLQSDSDLSTEKIAEKVNSSKSPVWSRIRRLKERGYIQREVAILDADQLGQAEVFFVSIKTDSHEAGWLQKFSDAVQTMDEIQEAHRLAGETDYMLKVRVRDTREFDRFYKDLVSRIGIFSVTSSLSMETLKSTTEIRL
ncbi:MAG: Lrp/AsnC family transcriptional regulator [Pseudomonadota bacterium]